MYFATVAESKESRLRSDDFGKDIASVQALLSKQVCQLLPDHCDQAEDKQIIFLCINKSPTPYRKCLRLVWLHSSKKELEDSRQ